nr:hypothetical protein [uncultured Campylobacter sp.]
MQKFLQKGWAAQGFKAKKRLKAEPAQDEYLISYINALKKEQNCASIAHNFLQNAKRVFRGVKQAFLRSCLCVA